MITTTFDLLKAHPFLTGMTDEHLRRLSAWAHGSILHAHTRVFEEGSQADRFWLLTDGHPLVVDGPGIRRLCEEDPAFGFELTRRFMRVVVERLQQTRIRLFDVDAPPEWLTSSP